MAHLSQNLAVGRDYAFHRHHGAVGVKGRIHGNAPFVVHVLGGNLTVFVKLVENLRLAYELALAVADGHGEYVAGFKIGKPGRFVCAYAHAHNRGNVSADVVESKRGTVLVAVLYVTERKQSQIDKRLEAVADA